MEGPDPGGVRRTLTPAVVGSAGFVAACAVVAIAFVAARGGIRMPVAATLPPVAVASQPATPQPSPQPTQSPVASVVPTAPPVAPSPAPASAPPGTATPPTIAPPSLDPNDPLLALPACPDLAGCFEYVVQRNDTLSGIASRFILPVSTVLALNPELTDPSTVVVGQVLYLGRDPMLRLEPCPGVPDCALYVVRPGDGLSSIAARFDVTVEAILDLNPEIGDQNQIFSGQAIRLPRAL